MSTDFYDANSPLDNSVIEDKSSIDPNDEDTIALCDLCENIILKPYKDTKLICTKCGQIYNPHSEFIQVQDQETTIDDLSTKGEMTFKDDSIKPRKTVNRSENNLENLEYVKREFDKYKQEEEIIDKPSSRSISRMRKNNESN